MKKALIFLAMFFMGGMAYAQTCPTTISACPDPSYSGITVGAAGVSLNGYTVNLGGNFTTGNALTFTTTGTTNVTLPTSGTLATLANPTFTGTVTIPGGTINGTIIGATTPATGQFTGLSITSNLSGGHLIFSTTTPTVSSGFGTSPSINQYNGTAGFQIIIGTGGTASTGVVTLPTAADGWACDAADVTTQSTSVFYTKETAYTTTSVTLTQYNDAAVATAWTAGDHVVVKCSAF